LVDYGNRFYSPALGRFISRDPIEELGGINLYAFCGNDGVNGFDVMGNSWLSSLWDRTIGSLGKHIAQNWDHGKQYAIAAVAIVAAVVTYGAASDWAAEAIAQAAYSSAIAGGASAMDAAVAGVTALESTSTAIIAGAVGGAAAGAVAGAVGVGLSGGNLGQVASSALRGAAAGAIMGGVDGYFGTSTPWERIPATAVAGGVSAQLSGGNFQQGLELGGIQGLAVYGWGQMRDFTDEVGGNTAANYPDPDRYNYDATGELRTDGTIPGQNGSSVFGSTVDEAATRMQNFLDEMGMSPQGVAGAHWYDNAPSWLGGGMNGPIAGFINEVSKVHDFWEGWDYNVSAGTFWSRGATFNSLYDVYGMAGMPVAGLYTAAALSPSTVYVAQQGH
jgi:hypothetical protein